MNRDAMCEIFYINYIILPFKSVPTIRKRPLSLNVINFFRKFSLGPIFSIALFINPGIAWALSASVSLSQTIAIGSCSVVLRHDPQIAYVYLKDSNNNILYAGGSYFMAGLYPGPFFPGPVPAITTAALTACLNGITGDVINVRQNGANGDFSTDDYIGFKFEVVTSGLTLGVGVYEYKIGTGAPFNDGPFANAGADQTVALGTTVTLNGTASSDVDGDTLTYAWSQSSGPTVTLSSTTVAQPTFTAPTLAVGDADATLVFSLTVNDGTVTSSADTVTITVEAPSPTPATAFAEYEEEIRATLVDDARRNLTSALSVNQRLVRDARGRMIETQQVLSGCNVDEAQNNDRVGSELDAFECTPNSVSTRNYVPFDVNGTLNMDATTVSTRGNFFEQTGNFETARLGPPAAFGP